MDFTYAEINDTSSHFYENVSAFPTHRSIYSSASSYSSSASSLYGNIRKVNMRSSKQSRDDSQLPIDIRYRKRAAVVSDAGYYSSETRSNVGSVSSSSMKTVINGPKPYRPVVSNRVTAVVPAAFQYSAPATSLNVLKTTSTKPCCVQCREKELREEFNKTSHHYENMKKLKEKKSDDPYVFLMLSVFRKLRGEDNGKKAAKVQQKIERVLRLEPKQLFCTEDEELFNRQITCFGNDVEIRLRAINDVSPDTYRDISAKFCEALHSSTNNRGIKGIFKGVKNFFTS